MTIEVSAKKVEDAINQGLAQLGATLDEVDVEVVDAGGLFRKAKVRLTVEREQDKADADNASGSVAQPVGAPSEKPTRAKEQKSENETREQKPERKTEKKNSERKPARKQEQVRTAPKAQPVQSVDDAEAKSPREKTEEDKAAAANALDFVTEVIAKMGFADATVAWDERGETLCVTAASGDDSIVIGRHGETLSALSYLAETYARAQKSRINVVVDCNGYRARRAASLTAMARRRADECVAKHRKIKLEAMERVDRRTVHNALTGDDRVTTASEGKEPRRYVVIIPR